MSHIQRMALWGAGGQLASALDRLCPGLVPLTRRDSDLKEAADIIQTLNRVDPEVVINAAAYNLVDQAESEPDVAYAVNALGPRAMARWCAAHHRTLVHISSDYVFGLDASRSKPYQESDGPGPLGAYAVSKLAGEQFVQAECPRHYVLRTCGLYGRAARPGKRNFVETMLKLATERDELSIVNDQHCTPTFVDDLARAILGLLPSGRYGLYHATNGGQTTWYDFAREIFRQTGSTVRVRPIPSSDYKTVARRPPYSVLDCGKLTRVLGRELRPWPEALTEYLRQRTA